jgi:ribonuclease P protein component
VTSSSFSAAEHIRRRTEFQHIYEHGAKVHGRYAILFILPNQRSFGRLGVAATRKFGGAVHRNRAKRLIREVFRQNKLGAGYDVVVVPKRQMLEASLTAFEAEYRQNIQRRVRPGTGSL